MEMDPGAQVERVPERSTRGFAITAALATLWFSAAIGAVACRRWRRAAFWLVTDWAWLAVFVAGILAVQPRVFWFGAFMFVAWRIPAAVDAYRVARIARDHASWGTLIRAWLVLTLGAIAMARGVVRPFFVEAFQMPSGSMLPTLFIGDHFFVDKRARNPQRGDVIVFEYPLDRATDYVKRVVALEGDAVEVAAGRLIVNGKEVWRERVQNGCPEGADALEVGPCVIWEETLGERRYQVGIDGGQGRGDMERLVVPPRAVFVLGDNRDNSSDSRVWGPVPLENIKGTARFIWWSRAPESPSVRWDRVNLLVR